MEKYCVNYAQDGASTRLKEFLYQIFGGEIPVVACIGTDAVAGDSLGPLVGSMLKAKLGGKTFILGSMDCPITAKEVKPVSEFLEGVFPITPVLAVDAALGKKEEIGNLKLCNQPVKPGLGVNKDLSPVGTASLIAVVEEKTGEKNLLSSVRFSLVYKMAEIISSAISDYVNQNLKISSRERNFYSAI